MLTCDNVERCGAFKITQNRPWQPVEEGILAEMTGAIDIIGIVHNIELDPLRKNPKERINHAAISV